jgi:hypothetical protein
VHHSNSFKRPQSSSDPVTGVANFEDSLIQNNSEFQENTDDEEEDEDEDAEEEDEDDEEEEEEEDDDGEGERDGTSDGCGPADDIDSQGCQYNDYGSEGALSSCGYNASNNGDMAMQPHNMT